MDDSELTLQKYFGYTTFRFNQKEIIASVISGKDVLAILPTGGGKSLCYQIPGLMLGGTALVISPLISLMKDQVDHLLHREIRATFFNSSLTEEEKDIFFTNFTAQRYQFVYVSPERLASETFITACQKLKLSLVAIDEAHCVSQWGHEFRPNYLLIHQFISKLTHRPPVIALTATATSKVQSEIIRYTGLRDPRIFVNSFKRTNLSIANKLCLNENDKQLWLLRTWLQNRDKKILIYCATRAGTELFAQLAQQLGFHCKYYHAGLDTAQKNAIQNEFTSGKLRMLTATSAFGMGIDIPDIRIVIHVQLPQNIESYYQEIGRAGRDGAESYCYLFHTLHDAFVAKEIFSKNYPDPVEMKKILTELVKKKADLHPLPIKDLSAKPAFRTLQALEKIGYINIVKKPKKTALQLLSKDSKLFKAWEIQRTVKELQIKSVQEVFSIKRCRAQKILNYFGEENTEKCGKCDICLRGLTQLSRPELKRREEVKKYTRKHLKKENAFPNYISTTQVKFLAIKDELFKVPGLGRGFREAYFGTAYLEKNLAFYSTHEYQLQK